MSKTDNEGSREEVAQRLMERIRTTKNTKLLIKLSAQLNKMIPKNVGRPINNPSQSALDRLPLRDRIVVMVENKCKGQQGGWSALQPAEKEALLVEVKKTLTAEELTALEAEEKE